MDTRERILRSAKKHFLEDGYRAASLRKIAADCGLTTGAIYAGFGGKDALFRAVVERELAALREEMDVMMEAQEMSGEDWQIVLDYPASRERFQALIDRSLGLYRRLFESRETLDLVLYRAQGSSYEGFLDRLIDMDEQGSLAIYEKIRKKAPGPVARRVLRIYTEDSIRGMLSLLRSGESYEEAEPVLKALLKHYWLCFASLTRYAEDEAPHES